MKFMSDTDITFMLRQINYKLKANYIFIKLKLIHKNIENIMYKWSNYVIQLNKDNYIY